MPARTPVVARPGGRALRRLRRRLERGRSVIRVWVARRAKAPVVASAAGGSERDAHRRGRRPPLARLDQRGRWARARHRAALERRGEDAGAPIVDAGRPEGLTMAHAIDGSDAGGALDLTAPSAAATRRVSRRTRRACSRPHDRAVGLAHHRHRRGRPGPRRAGQRRRALGAHGRARAGHAARRRAPRRCARRLAGYRRHRAATLSRRRAALAAAPGSVTGRWQAKRSHT